MMYFNIKTTFIHTQSKWIQTFKKMSSYNPPGNSSWDHHDSIYSVPCNTQVGSLNNQSHGPFPANLNSPIQISLSWPLYFSYLITRQKDLPWVSPSKASAFKKPIK